VDLDKVKNMLDLAIKLMKAGSDYNDARNSLKGIAIALSKYVQDLVSKYDFLKSVYRVKTVSAPIRPRELKAVMGDMTIGVDELRVGYVLNDDRPELYISFRNNGKIDYFKIDLCDMDVDELIFLYRNIDAIVDMLKEAIEVKKGEAKEMRRCLKDVISGLSELLAT